MPVLRKFQSRLRVRKPKPWMPEPRTYAMGLPREKGREQEVSPIYAHDSVESVLKFVLRGGDAAALLTVAHPAYDGK